MADYTDISGRAEPTRSAAGGRNPAFGRRGTAVLRIFLAILRKNMLEYIRYPAELIFSFIMPLVWFIPTYFLIISFAPEGESEGLASWTGSGDYFSYYLCGLVVSFIISTVFWGIGFSLKRLMSIGLLETIWSYPVSKISYIVGESLFSVVRTVYEMAIAFLLYRFLFGLRIPPGFPAVLPWMLPFLFMMYGFGIMFASIVMLAKDADNLVDTSSFLVSTLTGTSNPPQVFPPYLLAVSLAIPITYFIDFIRVRTLGIVPLVPVGIEIAVIIAGSLLFPVAGVLFFRWTDRKCRIKGNLSAH